MKQFLKEYFTFNRREQRGILALLSILIVLLAFLSVLKTTSPAQQYDFSAFEKEIAELEKETKGKEEAKNTGVEESVTIQKFNFDPNNLPEADWKRLGFSDKQIKTIKNYENKGGKFYRKDDLKKIYGISENLYLSLEPYIHLESKKTETSKRQETRIKNQEPGDKIRKIEHNKLEINTADSLQLVKLKGIGPVFASRILKYRKKLGGFVSSEQLKEVYGMTNETYEAISGQLIVDLKKMERININEAGIDQLKDHPYIKYKIANLIVNYRGKHGMYKTIEDLKNIDALFDSAFIKAAPYLTVN